MTKDQILVVTVLDNNALEARLTVRAFDDDGSLIGERHHRRAYVPTTPLTEVPAGKLRQIANLLWTPAVIAAYQASLTNV